MAAHGMIQAVQQKADVPEPVALNLFVILKTYPLFFSYHVPVK